MELGNQCRLNDQHPIKTFIKRIIFSFDKCFFFLSYYEGIINKILVPLKRGQRGSFWRRKKGKRKQKNEKKIKIKNETNGKIIFLRRGIRRNSN